METEKGQTVVIHNLWEWAKRVLIGEELSKLFLDKDIWGRTDWHMAEKKDTN